LGLANRTIHNAVFNLIGWMWPAALYLVTAPYVVRSLGTDAYGILVLVSTILGYFAFLELGLNTAAVKYVAEYYAKGDYNTINKVIGSTLAAYLLLGCLGAAIVASITSLLVTNVLRVPSSLMAVSKLAFYIAALGFLVNMVLSVFSSIPNALQRFDISNKIGILMGTVSTLLTVGLLALGYGLAEVVALNLLVSSASILVYATIAKIMIPQLSLRPSFDRAIFHSLVRFGGYTTVNRISGVILSQLDRMLVGMLLGASFVTFYVIPVSLAARIHSVISRLTMVLFPLASELWGSAQQDRVRAIYNKATRLVLLTSTSLAVPLVVLAPKILYYWMGEKFAETSSTTLILLVMYYYFASLTTVPYFVLDGIGRPQINAVFTTITGITNFVACLLLIPTYGLNGAALASLLSVFLIPVYVIYVETRFIGTNSLKLLNTVYGRPLFAALIVGLTTHLVLQNYIHSLVSLVVVFVLSILLYFAVALVTGALSGEDKRMFMRYVLATWTRVQRANS